MNGEVQKTLYLQERHLPLLITADPDTNMVECYIRESTVYEFADGEKLLGIAAVMRINHTAFEIKNIAIDVNAQRRGIGSKIIKYIIKNTRPFRLLVGTADVSSEALAFYERNGFKPCDVIKSFFIENYSEPVFDNGRLCKDMIILEWDKYNG